MRAVRRVLASIAIVGGVMLAGPASAQTSSYVNVTPPQVGAADAGRIAVQAAVPPQVRAPSAPAQVISRPAPARALAITGSDIIGLVALGGGSIVIGGLLVRSFRRRTEHPTTIIG